MSEIALDPTPESIALIDISALFKKRWHLNDPAKGAPKNAAAISVLKDLEQLSKYVDHLIICRDAPPYHRKRLYPDYKAGRPEMEDEERVQRKWLFRELTQAGYVVASSEGYEADDVIATLAHTYGMWCKDVRIVGADKDLAQCINDNVKQYIPPMGDRDWEVRDAGGVVKKFGVTPELMPLWQALKGDSTDNVPGVPHVGEKSATELCNQYKTLVALAQAVADAATFKRSRIGQSLAANWNDLVLSLKLTTLDTNVPLDTAALLVKREPQQLKPQETEPMQDGVDDAALREATRIYNEKLPELQKAAKDAGLLEKEYERERQQNEEHEAEVVTKPEPKQKAITPARPASMITVPSYTTGKYGMTSADLQPLDLESAATLAKWFHEGGLYKQFKNWQQFLAVIVRAKELRIGITSALGGLHVIEGKLVASAMMIRALAERDPNFEYLMPIEMTEDRCVWQGRNKSQPRPIDLPYTLADAKKAGLVRKTPMGYDGNWMIRPGEMLLSTTGCKLARVLWPGATMGLYCPEEFGYTMEELNEREAA